MSVLQALQEIWRGFTDKASRLTQPIVNAFNSLGDLAKSFGGKA